MYYCCLLPFSSWTNKRKKIVKTSASKRKESCYDVNSRVYSLSTNSVFLNFVIVVAISAAACQCFFTSLKLKTKCTVKLIISRCTHMNNTDFRMQFGACIALFSKNVRDKRKILPKILRIELNKLISSRKLFSVVLLLLLLLIMR